MDRLRVTYDKLTVINQQTEFEILNQEIMRILRVMAVLKEYLYEFDSNYLCERAYPPLFRAYRGKSVLILVRIPIQNRQNEDIELLSHSNETIGSLRRQIYQRAKLNPQVKIDLVINNECVECNDDNKILGDYQLKEKMVIIVKVTQNNTCVGSSPETSSDEFVDDQHHVIDSPKIEHEIVLPSVVSTTEL
jgi:ubiquitin carboxyl-terminal hydrolase 9/24